MSDAPTPATPGSEIDRSPDASRPPPVSGPPWQPPRLHPLRRALVLLLLVAGVALVLRAWGLPPFDGALERSSDAYVRGRTTVIAPQVSGYAETVAVQDYDEVRAGQLLVQIDRRVYVARVDQAQAGLDEALARLEASTRARAAARATLSGAEAGVTNARAQLDRARADMERVGALTTEGFASRQARDANRAALAAAQAGLSQAAAQAEVARQDLDTVDVTRKALQATVEAARAALRLARIDLRHTRIRAPESGRLGEIGVRAGQYVTDGTQLMQLVPADRWVIVNFKEAQIADIAPGQPAHFTVDALHGARLEATVERISPAAGAEFAVLKPDNATGNFVKTPQRIGVRLRIAPGQPMAERLRPGMSVEAAVDTSAPPRPTGTAPTPAPAPVAVAPLPSPALPPAAETPAPSAPREPG
ncbi:HlyD family secretion protein [Oceanicella sp. SM1341]|uniref:HlyD family secretion protein n=1 Tax=Oceanicella sp. SM1341 TaxID=1548889 RepID=UPI000E4A0C94|nr:HlyD family secretion protein [Oceanicella sp. SM1341]